MNGWLRGAGPFVAAGLLIALCGAARGCDDVRPAQRPVIPPSIDPLPSWRPARPGDVCSPAGAVRHSNTGGSLTCGRHRGLSYDTWG